MELATINIQSRPLRFVYLVENRDDILDAVKFYTHLWGGFANAIFPIPRNEQELESLKFALSSISPDFIISSNPISEDLTETIKQFCYKYIEVSSTQVTNFTDYQLWINSYQFPYIIPLLKAKYPMMQLFFPLSYFCRLNNDVYDFYLGLQGGIISDNYQHFLQQHLNARQLNDPQDIHQLLKTSFVLANYKQPLYLTDYDEQLTGATIIPSGLTCESYYKWLTYNKSLYLFLDDSSQIEVSLEYWNACLINRQNKILVPKNEFLTKIDDLTNTILQIMPSLESLCIITLCSRGEAEKLAQQLKQTFDKKEKDINVEISYSNLGYNFINPSFYGDQTTKISQLVAENNSVCFSPIIPSAYRNYRKHNYLFGYDASIAIYSRPIKVFIPLIQANQKLSILFSNDNQYIDIYERSGINLPVNIRNKKSGSSNLTGITSMGEECKIYIPSGEFIVSKYLKIAGLELRINEHTRYAKGFIKRFGGISKAIFIIDKIGADILRAFLKHKSDAESLEWGQHIQKFLGQECNYDKSKIKNILNDKIPKFLEKSLIYRGYSPHCTSCNLVNFYSLDKVKEFNECRGCGEYFLLPLKSQITYKLNELASKLFKTGGLAILMTLYVLCRIEWSSYIQLGGELIKQGESKNFAEVDLFWLTERCLTIAECKSIYQIRNPEKINNTINAVFQQFNNLIVNVSSLIDAKVVVLSIVTDLTASDLNLFSRIEESVNLGQEYGVKVHLIFNWELFIEGKEKVDLVKQQFDIIDQFFPDHRNIQTFDTIKIEKSSQADQKSPYQAFVFDEKILNEWRESIVINP